jgi:two-component system, OmpR family, phosphate regulon sensor histidine kinase PhoR
MLDFSKLSTQKIAAFFAGIISLFLGIILIGFKIDWYVKLGILFSLFIFSWAVCYYFYYYFLDAKIKLIYKTIYSTKASKRQEFYNKELIPKETLQEVELKVDQWSKDAIKNQEQEIQSEKYRKEFLQNICHELKTPIFAIQGYIEILQDGGINNEALAQKYLNNSKKNIERLTSLVKDIDEITNLEIGTAPLNITSFNINECMLEVLDSISLLLKPKQITYAVKKESFLKVIVKADKEKIKQVLLNLFENAIKYGKEKGVIELAIYKPNEDRYLIEISDNGYGIAPNHLNRVFERFYRTDHARSRKIGGSGLGLAICKHIIEAHNQTIHVRSSLEVGTTFGFTLSKG